MDKPEDDKRTFKIRILRNGYLLSTSVGPFAYADIDSLLVAVKKLLEETK